LVFEPDMSRPHPHTLTARRQPKAPCLVFPQRSSVQAVGPRLGTERDTRLGMEPIIGIPVELPRTEIYSLAFGLDGSVARAR
jgi:hypothetical protein